MYLENQNILEFGMMGVVNTIRNSVTEKTTHQNKEKAEPPQQLRTRGMSSQTFQPGNSASSLVGLPL